MAPSSTGARRLSEGRPDDELVCGFRSGDEQAFVEIHDRYRGRVLRQVSQMVADRPLDAEAITQEVFLRAHRGLLRNDDDIELWPWLRKVARNRCLDALETKQARSVEPTELEHRLPARNDDPLDQLIRREEFDKVVADLGALPNRQRSALIAQELEGRSQQEVASELGVSVGAVKSLVVRARRSLVATRVFAPLPALLRAIEQFGPAGKVAGVAAAGATTALIAVGVTQVIVDPVQAPERIAGGRVLIGETIRKGDTLPPGLALVGRRVALPAGLAAPGPRRTLTLRCPSGFVARGLREVPGGVATRLREYDVGQSALRGPSLKIEYRAAAGLPSGSTARLGIVCRRPGAGTP